MKTWNDETRSENIKLEAENRRLRAELAHVKAILMAHQNCPITKVLSIGKWY